MPRKNLIYNPRPIREVTGAEEGAAAGVAFWKTTKFVVIVLIVIGVIMLIAGVVKSYNRWSKNRELDKDEVIYLIETGIYYDDDELKKFKRLKKKERTKRVREYNRNKKP